MKIIKTGKVVPMVKPEGTEVECPYCESVLLYFKEDVRKHPNEDGLFFYINCPVCANLINIMWVYTE